MSNRRFEMYEYRAVLVRMRQGCQCRMNNTHLCRSKSYQFEV